jgi:hypothetical protein
LNDLVKLRRFLLMVPLPFEALVRVAPGSGTANFSPYQPVSIRRKHYAFTFFDARLTGAVFR